MQHPHAVTREREPEAGFTLIELMMVVLIIAILIAVLIPTFVGAKQRAQDRAMQSSIRNALTAAKVVYSDHGDYTQATVAGLATAEPASELRGRRPRRSPGPNVDLGRPREHELHRHGRPVPVGNVLLRVRRRERRPASACCTRRAPKRELQRERGAGRSAIRVGRLDLVRSARYGDARDRYSQHGPTLLRRDSVHRSRRRYLRTRCRLVPERRDLAGAAARVDREAAFALPVVRHADRDPRQHPGRVVADPARSLPALRRTTSRRVTRSSSSSPECCSPQWLRASRTRGRCRRSSC